MVAFERCRDSAARLFVKDEEEEEACEALCFVSSVYTSRALATYSRSGVVEGSEDEIS